EQVVSIFSGVKGYLDKIKVEDVTRFEQKFLSEIRAKGADILAAIRNDKQITKETEEKLKAFLDSFAKVFV
ncbi:MAG TPA: F0F1 ATP synthase subunit alpha, partial [Azospirillum sp.]|nr:F0F1 ATP synthase subunit alpha [Azospirillum sp.]